MSETTLSASVSKHLNSRSPHRPDAQTALIVVDVQNGFVTGGNLAVPQGEAVVPVINRIAPSFVNVMLTQDWHPSGHASFASSHAGKRPFETTTLAYGTQVLWPEHCVQGSHDAMLHADLHVPQAQLIIRKGFHPQVDSYSAFQEADRQTPTGLDGYLKQRGITRLFVCGLATDFCVAWTALDARRLGYETWVIEDATRAIDLDGSLQKAWSEMAAQGVGRIQSADLALG
jgi:nicotinamidase/pyrazinamidase